MKNNNKVFHQTINLKYLEIISELISDNYDAFAHAYSFKKSKNKKIRKFEYYNLLCTCILRIRETSRYLMNYSFRQKNVCGQAFDFYEFINCLSIIYSCSESLLEIFNFNLKDDFKGKQYFIKSNRTREGDYKFFKFIRSAAVAHPDNTTNYPKISKRNNEIYPYAVWTSKVFDLLKTEREKDSDISLLSWASSERSQYKRYYLYIDEFYNFINAVVEDVNKAIPTINSIIERYKNRHRCKRLKAENKFDSYHEYLMYLRKRMLSLNTNKYEYPDGGILLADHVILNPIISSQFKGYIKKRVNCLTQMMVENFEEIGFDFIFDELDLYETIKNECEDPWYVDEKFYRYLKMEAVNEIKNNEYSCFIPDLALYRNDPQAGNKAFWAVYKLFSCNSFIDRFKDYSNYGKLNYADIYEMSLELIYEKTIKRKE